MASSFEMPGSLLVQFLLSKTSKMGMLSIRVSSCLDRDCLQVTLTYVGQGLTVRSGASLKSEPVSCASRLPHLPHQTCQLGVCFSWIPSTSVLSIRTQPGDSVAQLVRAWQAICQVVGSSPSLSHCHFFPPSLFPFISFLLTNFDLG